MEHETRLSATPAPNDPAPVCSIVIPTYNNSFFTRLCLHALAECRSCEPPFEVIVVDNASDDDTLAIVARYDSIVARVVRNESNRGFAVATNQGARLARGKYVVFLNNDVVVERGCLSALIAAAESDPSVGVAGARLLYPDGTIQHAGVVFSEGGHPRHAFAGYPADWSEALRPRDYQAVTGACLLVERRLLEEVGYLDEGFLNSFEDVDLCFKIRKLGRRVIYCPDATAYHFESSTPGRFLRDDRNFARFLDRWGDTVVDDFDPAVMPDRDVASPASRMRIEFETLSRKVRHLTAQYEHLQTLLLAQTHHPRDASLADAAAPALSTAADLTYRPALFSPAPAGSIVEVPIILVNEGARGWSACQLRVSYHWLRQGESQYMIWDGLRTDVEEALAPGMAVGVSAAVQLPDAPGTYILEWDAVEEGVAWMSMLGVVPYRQTVDVIDALRTSIVIDDMPSQLDASEVVEVTARFDGEPTGWDRANQSFDVRWVRIGSDGKTKGVGALVDGPHPTLVAGSRDGVRLTVIAPAQPGLYRLDVVPSGRDARRMIVQTIGGSVLVRGNGDARLACPAQHSDVETSELSADLSLTPPDPQGLQKWFYEELDYRAARIRQAFDREHKLRLSLEAELEEQRQKTRDLADLLERYRNGRVMRLLTAIERIRHGSDGERGASPNLAPE